MRGGPPAGGAASWDSRGESLDGHQYEGSELEDEIEIVAE